MKKLLLTLSVIAGLLSNAFAIDLISLATNGKSNENSLGVKTLNNQEMSEIVGGFVYLGSSSYGTQYYFIEVQKDVYQGLSTSDKRSVENEYKWLSGKLYNNEVLTLAVDSRGTYIAAFNTATKTGRDMSLFGNSTKFYKIADKNFR